MAYLTLAKRCFKEMCFQFFLELVQTDIRPNIKWAVSLVITYGHFNRPLGANMITLSPPPPPPTHALPSQGTKISGQTDRFILFRHFLPDPHRRVTSTVSNDSTYLMPTSVPPHWHASSQLDAQALVFCDLSKPTGIVHLHISRFQPLHYKCL